MVSIVDLFLSENRTNIVPGHRGERVKGGGAPSGSSWVKYARQFFLPKRKLHPSLPTCGNLSQFPSFEMAFREKADPNFPIVRRRGKLGITLRVLSLIERTFLSRSLFPSSSWEKINRAERLEQRKPASVEIFPWSVGRVGYLNVRSLSSSEENVIAMPYDFLSHPSPSLSLSLCVSPGPKPVYTDTLSRLPAPGNDLLAAVER